MVKLGYSRRVRVLSSHKPLSKYSQRGFLAVVLWLSESGNKVVIRGDAIASATGLRIEADKNLPDLILADLGDKEPLILFVEVVATDGAITDRRVRPFT
ncbi:BsuBI/PstI family type II restriction endonuclease [Nordella sp. HKS 07]|uniref:BsuBI/PstI family type II restriction endonuclease n=1 Tax=Nordella sp. HKS 07 TaxID=2712222 RepID=UPI00210F3901|nr:BsuBI/PstI family type II restriction endonuclease [Nordella sp. HKS 07]